MDCPQGCDCETGRPPGKRAAGAGGRAAEADGAAASSAPPARGERQDRPRRRPAAFPALVAATHTGSESQTRPPPGQSLRQRSAGDTPLREL